LTIRKKNNPEQPGEFLFLEVGVSAQGIKQPSDESDAYALSKESRGSPEVKMCSLWTTHKVKYHVGCLGFYTCDYSYKQTRHFAKWDTVSRAHRPNFQPTTPESEAERREGGKKVLVPKSENLCFRRAAHVARYGS
jgi:hypothetical protein